MSFLNELQLKRSKLKPTETTVTLADGTRYKTTSESVGMKIDLGKFSGFVVDTKPDLEAACILQDFLYLGSQDAVNEENVVKLGIRNILSVGIDTPPSLSVDIDRTVIKHYLPCLDIPETDMASVFNEANAIINSIRAQSQSVLIHCNAGVSRSATICIAYLMINEQLSFDAALELVKSRRPCTRPNDGFLKQLKNLSK